MLRCVGLGSLRELLGLKKSTSEHAIQQGDFRAALDDAAGRVERWDEDEVVLVKDLQDAARNLGKVQLMKELQEGRFMAVKRMPNHWVRRGHDDFNRHNPGAFERPWVDIALVKLLRSLDFPFVCQLYSVKQSELETFVATTFCVEGDLYEWCYKRDVPAPGLEREVRMRPIVGQLISAVCWLHDLGVAHRDLSLENVLLERRGEERNLRLIDFGMATLKRLVHKEPRGKKLYQAPETHGFSDVDTFLVDNFAVGVILYTMGAQDYPWTSTERGRCQLFEYFKVFGLKRYLVRRRLRTGHGECLSEVLSPEYADVLASLLEPRPFRRASLGELVFKTQANFLRRPSICDMPWVRKTDAHLLTREVVLGEMAKPTCDDSQSEKTVESLSTFSNISSSSPSYPSDPSTAEP